MTTDWLLLLLVVVSSQSVDSQSTIGDEVCDGVQLSEIREYVKTLLDNQMRKLERVQQDVDTLTSTLSSQQQMLQQLQPVVNRLGM